MTKYITPRLRVQNRIQIKRHPLMLVETTHITEYEYYFACTISLQQATICRLARDHACNKHEHSDHNQGRVKRAIGMSLVHLHVLIHVAYIITHYDRTLRYHGVTVYKCARPRIH